MKHASTFMPADRLSSGMTCSRGITGLQLLTITTMNSRSQPGTRSRGLNLLSILACLIGTKMNKEPNNFIIIVDSVGDVRESLMGNTPRFEVLNLVKYFEQADDAADGSYAAWLYKDGVFRQLSREDSAISAQQAKVVDVFSMPLHSLTNDEEYLEWRSKLTRDPYVMGGNLTYPGTRVTVSNIMSLIKSGISLAELEADYPGLTRRDLEFTNLMCEEIYSTVH